MTRKGNIFIFLGALFWSLNAPIISGVDLPPLFVACYRALIGGLVLSPFIKRKELKLDLNLIIFLISYFGLSTSVTVALKYTSAPIAIGMQYASIFWIFLVNFFFLKQREFNKIPAIVLITIGVVLFMTSGSTAGSAFGNLLAFLESIFFAGMTISSNKLKDINPLGLTSLGNLLAGLILFVAIGGDRFLILHLTGAEYIAIGLLGAVQIALGYGCYNIGLKYTSTLNASLIAIAEMILGPLWVYLFLHIASSRQTMIGFAFIICGLVVNWLAAKYEQL